MLVVLSACDAGTCKEPAARLLRGAGEDFVGQPPAPRIAAFLDSLADQGVSGVALVAHGSDVILRTGFGWADRDTQSPNTATTVFDIGSIATTITAAALFQLEAQGKLQIDAPLSRYLDAVPAEKHNITVLQLLNHGSGLENYVADGDFDPLDREQAVRRSLGLALRWLPGEERDGYSNAGYALLAAIVESASGMSFRNYVRAAVLEPLGMQRTGWFCDSALPPQHYATGYTGAERAGNPCCWRLTWALMGGGGMVAAVDDLYGLMQAVVRGPFFSDEARNAMHTAPAGRYTAGLQWRSETTGAWLQKGGSTLGFTGLMRYHPQRDLYVIFLLNSWIAPYDNRVHLDLVAPRLSRLALEDM